MLLLKRVGLIAAVVCAGWASTAAGAILEVGHHFIAPDEVSQIMIMIAREAGDPDIDGLNLAVQIADGTFGPTIGPIDLETGTIFAANNTGSDDQGSAAWQAFWGITTQTGPVAIPAGGLLATIELDATGLFGGTFDLTVSEVSGAPTELLRIVSQDVEAIGLTVNDGRVTVIPEPAGLGLFALAPLFRRRR